MTLELRLNEELEQLDIFSVKDEEGFGEEMIGTIYKNEDGQDVVSLLEDLTLEDFNRLYLFILRHTNKETMNYVDLAKGKYTYTDEYFDSDVGSSYEDCY